MPPTIETPTDAELFDRFRAGEATAATVIYDRYADRLRAVIRRRCSRTLAACVEPDDLLQSAFGSFFRRVADRTADGTHPDRLWGLLLLISAHKIRDAADYHCAAKRDARRLSHAALAGGGLPEVTAPDETIFRELSDLVTHLVTRLPEPDDRIVHLRIQGYEVAEISNRTARSKRTVERVLQGFRRNLESLIREGWTMVSRLPGGRVLEFRELVEAYEEACANGTGPDLAGYLPPREHALHHAVLCELVCIELERGFNLGRGRNLDEYRARYPELAARPEYWREIVSHEFRLREDAGQRPNPDRYRDEYGVDVRTRSSAEIPTPHDAEGDGLDKTRIVQVAGAEVERLLHTSKPILDGARGRAAPSFAARREKSPPIGDLFRGSSASAEGAVEPDTKMPTPGTDFVGFHLVREIGRGAFSRVFLARQSDLADRFVVLKVATDHFQESQTLAQLQHTNIVPIYSRHPAGTLQAVCMPYLGATTFADVLGTVRRSQQFPRSGRQLLSTRRPQATLEDNPTVVLPSGGKSGPAPSGTDSSTPSGATPGPGSGTAADQPEGAPRAQPWLDQLAEMTYVDAMLTLFGRLADGLSHAHARGILHRDLKPANVLLTDDGEPMLLDFNLSADTKPESGAGVAGIGGTLPYMAPEHLRAFRGEPVPVDARSDVYGLGVILFEMLTGQHPFPARGGPVWKILPEMIGDRTTAPLLRNLNPEISPAVESIVRTCLAPDPAARYQTPDQLRDDIRRHLDDLSLKHAPNPSVAERFRKWRRRHPRGVPAILLLLVTGMLAGATVLLAREHDRRRVQQEEQARVETVLALKEFEDRSFEINYRLNALHPDDRQLGEGIALCERTLARFGSLDEDGWAPAPETARLGPDDRGRLTTTAGEYLLILAQSRVTQAEREKGDERQKLLVRSLALNESAGRCFPEGSAPRQLWAQRAVILYLLEGPERAAGAAAEASRTPLRDAWDRYTLARNEAAAGRVREAVRLAREAVRQYPNHFGLWFLLGHSHQLLGETTEAIRCYSCCLTLRPEFDPPYLRRGVAYLAEKKFAEAQRDFDQVIKNMPDQPDAYLDRALARDGLGDAAGALADLDRVVALGDRHTRAYFLRARIREKSGDPAGAKRDREEGLKREPTDPNSWVARGLYKADHGDPAGALADYRKALDLDPTSLAALQNSAVVLTDNLNRPADAVACLDRALKVDPDHLPALRGRAVLLARLGRRADAHADIAAALRLEPSATTRYYAACVYALTSAKHPDDRAKAVEQLRTALVGGFGLEYLEQDDDLKPIRDIPDFRNLVTAVRVMRDKPTGGR